MSTTVDTSDCGFGPDVDPTHDPVFGPGASTSEAGAAPSTTPRDDLSRPDQAWRLFCQGRSYTAIARELTLDRHTVARYVKQIHDETHADRRADRSLALTRALGALAQIQSQAWDTIRREEGHERVVWDLYLRAASQAAEKANALSGGYTVRPLTYRAQTARLLSLILTALREVARLELLDAETAPARDGDVPNPDEHDHHLYIMMRRSDQEALAQMRRAAAGDAGTVDPAATIAPDDSSAPTDSDLPESDPPDQAAAAADPDTAPDTSPTSAAEVLDADGHPPIPHDHPKPDLRPDGTDDWYVYNHSPLAPPRRHPIPSPHASPHRPTHPPPHPSARTRTGKRPRRARPQTRQPP